MIMADDFEKMMNEKMDDASLHDVLPGFDKSAVWDELETRIPANKKKPVFVWWSHAAAIIGGILIGGMMLQLFFRQDTGRTNANVAAIEQPAVQPEVIIKTDTVIITKEAVPVYIAAKEEKTTAPKPIPQKQETIIAQQEEQPVQEEQIPVLEIIKDIEPREVIAQAVPKKVKPVHLLDIDNEDRMDALYNNEPSVTQKSGFALHISAKRLPNTNTKQKSLLTGLLKK